MHQKVSLFFRYNILLIKFTTTTNFWKAATVEIGKAMPQVIVGFIIFVLSFLLAILVKFIIVRMANRSKTLVPVPIDRFDSDDGDTHRRLDYCAGNDGH